MNALFRCRGWRLLKNVSEYRYMRILLFFDLPMSTPTEVRRYTHFRKFLLSNGYIMVQFSVYSKILQNRDGVKWHMDFLKKHLPPDGSVISLSVTEKQYASMKLLVGSKLALDSKITSKKLLVF